MGADVTGRKPMRSVLTRNVPATGEAIRNSPRMLLNARLVLFVRLSSRETTTPATPLPAGSTTTPRMAWARSGAALVRSTRARSVGRTRGRRKGWGMAPRGALRVADGFSRACVHIVHSAAPLVKTMAARDGRNAAGRSASTSYLRDTLENDTHPRTAGGPIASHSDLRG